MGVTAAAIAEYFGSAAAAEGASAAAASAGTAAGTATAAELGTAAAADYAAGLIPAGAAGAVEAAGGTLGITAGGVGTAAKLAGQYAVLKAMMPSKPGVAPVVGMPDAKAQAEARRRSLADQMTRRGRASTVLTSDKLGG
jgi:hypothetical protein